MMMLNKRAQFPRRVSLPDEIIEDILSRLPLKSLGQSRCVCKSWSKLLHDPMFLNMHINQSKRNKENIKVIVNANEIYSYKDNACTREVVKLKPAYYHRSCNYQVCGSCNGLVCILPSLWNPTAALLNPATGEHMELAKFPCFPSPQWSCYTSHRVLSIYYDNDFKVVFIMCFCDENSTDYTSYLAIYSLREKKWKMKGKIGIYIPSRQVAVVNNGSLHWTASKTSPVNDKPKEVVAFDITGEKFVELPQGKEMKTGDDFINLDVAELGGKLCIMYNYAYRYELWRMNEYGVRESWSNIFIIKHPRASVKVELFELFKFHWVPLCVIDDGKSILIKSNTNLVVYDIGEKRLTRLLIGDDNPTDLKRFWKDAYETRFQLTTTYIESLVSLHG